MRSMDPRLALQQFHESRADQELKCAEAARCEEARHSHARLASLHRERAERLGMWSGDMPRRARSG